MTDMSGYNIFSSFYDELTFNIDYKKRAKYLLDCQNLLNRQFGYTLDLACGTGSLLLELDNLGVDCFGADSSLDMLSVATDKFYDNNKNIFLINQDMTSLCLPYYIDTCVSTLDSINHLVREEHVIKTFKNVYKYLNNDGAFIFDVNTIYKHQSVLSNNTITYDTDNIYLIWKNTLKDDNIVDIDLEFHFHTDEEIVEHESFSERAYEIDSILNWLSETGFKKTFVYEDMTFEKLKENSEKAMIIALK